MNPHNMEHGMLVLDALLCALLLVVGLVRLRRLLARKRALEKELVRQNGRAAALAGEIDKLKAENRLLRSDWNPAERMPVCESLRKRDMPELKSNTGVGFSNYAMMDWEEVEMMDEINRNFNNFGIRLMSAYPDIKEKELTTCCLMLLKIKTKRISMLMGETYSTTTKRIQKLVETFGTENPNDFIEAFAGCDTENQIQQE